MKWGAATATLVALCGMPALARADSFTPVSVGAQASTLGFGFTLERPLLFNFSARLATGFLSVSDETEVGGAAWTRTFREQNVLLAADWRPYAGRYRLTGGLLLSGDRTTYVAESVDGTNYAINKTLYPVSQVGVVRSQVSYSHPAVYVGVGGGTGITRGFTIAFDAGLILRNGSVAASATGPLQNDPRFQSDLQTVASQFRTRWVQPVLDIGLVYRP
jgi:hypothetical protein